MPAELVVRVCLLDEEREDPEESTVPAKVMSPARVVVSTALSLSVTASL